MCELKATALLVPNIVAKQSVTVFNDIDQGLRFHWRKSLLIYLRQMMRSAINLPYDQFTAQSCKRWEALWDFYFKKEVNRLEGKIKRLIRERGFGFITAEDGEDVFFHRSALVGEDFDALEEGANVEFDLEKGPKGHRAANVRVGDTFLRQKGGEQIQGYCLKCRAKREIKDARAITMKNGKPATQGVCPICGTKMFRIGKSEGQ